MKVREAGVADAAALARILQSVEWLWAAGEPLPQLETAAGRFLAAAAAAPDSIVLLAEKDGAGVGFLALHLFPAIGAEREGYVSHLFVHAAARGEGAGRQLLAAAEQEAATRGCNRLLLYIGRARPAYHRAFYAKAGWQEREDAALFVRHLEPGTVSSSVQEENL